MRRLPPRRGANAIEFALILPVLVAILTGIVDYGWVFMLRTAALTAAREGSRTGAQTPQAGGPDSAAATKALAKWNELGLPVAAPTIVAFRTGSPQLMVVRVHVNTASLIGFVVGPSAVESTSVQRMEEQP